MIQIKEINTTKLKDGEHKVTALVWDDKEKLEDAGIWIIVKNTKENLAPHIEITHPKNEATVSGVIVIKGKAWDTDGKIINGVSIRYLFSNILILFLNSLALLSKPKLYFVLSSNLSFLP